MKKKLKRFLPDRITKANEPTRPEIGGAITNETVAANREEMLSTARKYIYPLQHSKHKIVLVSLSLFFVAIVIFFSYSILSLYRFKNSSTFLYRVTQVVPFPIAYTGSKFVAYENYLFELRHYTHYYQTQQKLDFTGEQGKQQLADYKKRALDKVIDDAYVKQLAQKHNIKVTNQELEDQIAIVRSQNRLGANDKSLETTLRDNFGWSVSDFKRSLKQQLLAQKVASTLDQETNTKAGNILTQVHAGMDFGAAAKQFSDDTATKDSGGEFGFAVDKTNPDLPAQTTAALFKLMPGEVSDLVNIGYSLEIIKNIENQGDKIRGAHILFRFKDINDYLNPLKDQQKTRRYIRL